MERKDKLGPALYVLSLQFYIAQPIVASAWPPTKPYHWPNNVISDLGHTVDSPLHAWMNASFVLLGLTMIAGSLLTRRTLQSGRALSTGFGLLAVAGFGTILVGLAPENVHPHLHTLGAALPFLLGNLALVILGLALRSLTTTLLGGIALAALPLFLTGHDLGLGSGNMERIVAYPQSLWMIAYGLRTLTRRNAPTHPLG